MGCDVLAPVGSGAIRRVAAAFVIGRGTLAQGNDFPFAWLRSRLDGLGGELRIGLDGGFEIARVGVAFIRDGLSLGLRERSFGLTLFCDFGVSFHVIMVSCVGSLALAAVARCQGFLFVCLLLLRPIRAVEG